MTQRCRAGRRSPNIRRSTPCPPPHALAAVCVPPLFNKDLTMGIPDPVLVSPEAFTTAMTARWTTLGNTPSPRLEQLWLTMASTFSAAIAGQDDKWRVLQPPTGTGKTQGLCLY